MTDLRKRWSEKVAELNSNRVGRTPKDRALEEKIAGELRSILFRLAPEERDGLEVPEAPVYGRSTDGLPQAEPDDEEDL